MRKFYFSAIHRHTLFNIVSKYVQLRIKKGAGMQVQSPEFCCFKYHLLDSVLHLINIANYNKHPNKTNIFFVIKQPEREKKKRLLWAIAKRRMSNHFNYFYQPWRNFYLDTQAMLLNKKYLF